MPTAPAAAQALNLPSSILEAWRAAVLALAKLPRGTRKSEMAPEELLGTVLRQETGAIIDLWEVFTQERGELARSLLGTQRQTVAYLLGFHLVNAARAMLLLRRVQERTALKGWLKQLQGRCTIYDLGCGTGAVAHALVDGYAQTGYPLDRMEVHLYDGTASLLEAATLVLTSSALQPAQVKTHRLGLERLDGERLPVAGGQDVHHFALGYVWNELAKNQGAKARLGRLFHAQMAGRTLIYLLEPATQPFSRAAMELRDQLVSWGYIPLYPCPAPLPCPMLNLSRDWCYSEGHWQQPKIMQTLDRSLGIDRVNLNGTLMAFASPSLAPELKLTAPTSVVVGRPERQLPNLPERGTERGGRNVPFDYLICTGPELKKVAPAPGSLFLARGKGLNEG